VKLGGARSNGMSVTKGVSEQHAEHAVHLPAAASPPSAPSTAAWPCPSPGCSWTVDSWSTAPLCVRCAACTPGWATWQSMAAATAPRTGSKTTSSSKNERRTAFTVNRLARTEDNDLWGTGFERKRSRASLKAQS